MEEGALWLGLYLFWVGERKGEWKDGIVPFRCGRPLSEGSGSSFLVPAGSLPHSIPFGVGRPPLHYTLWWGKGE